MTTRIYIVDDHPLVRQGLSQIINNEADMEICGEAEDAPQAMKGVGTATVWTKHHCGVGRYLARG